MISSLNDAKPGFAVFAQMVQHRYNLLEDNSGISIQTIKRKHITLDFNFLNLC